jgi:hypothetical protein
MATTYTLIDKAILGSAQTSVTFSSIPSTYTDLKLVISARSNNNDTNEGNYYTVGFNNSTASYTNKFLRGNGSAASSGSFAQYGGNSTSSLQTASTFSNDEIYIPNYLSSNNKSFSGDSVTENNATAAFATLNAGLWSVTDAITSIKLESGGGSWSFQINSSFYLYGIKNS